MLRKLADSLTELRSIDQVGMQEKPSFAIGAAGEWMDRGFQVEAMGSAVFAGARLQV